MTQEAEGFLLGVDVDTEGRIGINGFDTTGRGPGTEVTVTAASCCRNMMSLECFEYWTGDSREYQFGNSFTITMDSDKEVIAWYGHGYAPE